ncbi:PREDICTED: centrosomal protein of 112 kDa-like, partial [Apaloderma vittatum]|uniref:centrosomal protein of 112 kDa-like n=1 Tax=Apaloderma vittatum TaxID=57397 RepID=UPI0005214205
IVELKLEHEQEKTHLFQQHNAEKDCLVRDHEREIEKLEKQLRTAMAEHESKTQGCRKRDGQVICDMQNQIQKLREELIQANSRLKQTEKECSQKLAKSSQIIAELETTISSLTEENSRQQLAAEQRLQEVVQKFEDKKQQLITDNDRAIKALQDEVESYRLQARAAEKKLHRRELETQEQITHIRQEYETTLKGLMPASLRQELEDTIVSLKSQVNILEKRVSILQEELNIHHARSCYLNTEIPCRSTNKDFQKLIKMKKTLEDLLVPATACLVHQIAFKSQALRDSSPLAGGENRLPDWTHGK